MNKMRFGATIFFDDLFLLSYEDSSSRLGKPEIKLMKKKVVINAPVRWICVFCPVYIGLYRSSCLFQAHHPKLPLFLLRPLKGLRIAKIKIYEFF